MTQKDAKNGMIHPEGVVLWLTGLPASGKTTLAFALKRVFNRYRFPVVVMDSDEMRRLLTPRPTYEPEERDSFYAILSDLAVWLVQNGIHVIISATAHRRAYRDDLRQRTAEFVEIFVECSLQECRQRDPKGIYAGAADQPDNQVPGLGVAYEPPLDPEIVIDTEKMFPRPAAEKIFSRLVSMEILNPQPEISFTGQTPALFAAIAKK